MCDQWPNGLGFERFYGVLTDSLLFGTKALRAKHSFAIRITNLVRVEIRNAYRHPVFHLEGADIMQERSGALVFSQVLSHMTGKKARG